MIAATQKSTTCTVRLSGGLGNQLFQYAAGRALSLRSGANLLLDVSFYLRKRRRQRQLDIARFPICGTLVPAASDDRAGRWMRALGYSLRNALRPGTTYREPHASFDDEFPRLRAPVTIDGYFQSEKYFRDYSAVIREDLSIPEPTDPATRRIGERIKSDEGTSLHVRRGDYVTDPKASETYVACSPDYYHAAMERIEGSGPVFVFSDDISWAKENLRDVKPLVFPEGAPSRSAMDDFWLMSQARNHIIANSTFSWWSAWLAVPDRGVTVAPAAWFKDAGAVDVDLIPESWIRL